MRLALVTAENGQEGWSPGLSHWEHRAARRRQAAPPHVPCPSATRRPCACQHGLGVGRTISGWACSATRGQGPGHTSFRPRTPGGTHASN